MAALQWKIWCSIAGGALGQQASVLSPFKGSSQCRGLPHPRARPFPHSVSDPHWGRMAWPYWSHGKQLWRAIPTLELLRVSQLRLSLGLFCSLTPHCPLLLLFSPFHSYWWLKSALNKHPVCSISQSASWRTLLVTSVFNILKILPWQWVKTSLQAPKLPLQPFPWDFLDLPRI